MELIKKLHFTKRLYAEISHYHHTGIYMYIKDADIFYSIQKSEK